MKSNVIRIAAVVLLAMLANPTSVAIAQVPLTHTGTTSALSQIDKELAETQKQKADAEDAAAAARKEAAAARKHANELRAEKIKAKTAEDKKAFDDEIAKAQADADSADAEAKKNQTTAEERLRHQGQLTFERVKYEKQLKEEEEQAKNRKEADKLNKTKPTP